jgi:hypothetical protein
MVEAIRPKPSMLSLILPKRRNVRKHGGKNDKNEERRLLSRSGRRL